MEEIKVSIFRRSSQRVYQMQYRDPITGDKVRKSSKETTLRGAERAASKWEEQVRSSKDHRAGRMIWAEFRKRYEDDVLTGLAEATEKKACGVLEQFEGIAKPSRLRDVTPDALTLYQSTLRKLERAESTIKGHLAHLRAALSWAFDQDLIPVVPKFPKTQRAKASKVMKGRPITTEEFERTLSSVEKVILKPNLGRKKEKPPADLERVPSWKHFLRGLWASGLRLEESLALRWDEPGGLLVDFSCRHPMLRIAAEAEKGHKDRLLPMAPEFAEFLELTPEGKRTGYVFNPVGQRHSGRLSAQQVGKVVQAIGKAANVVVDRVGTVNPKYASAHDLRRSFGARWSERVMPQILMELMRHESIDTTLRFYVGQNAQRTAAVLWEASRKAGASLGASGQKSGENVSQTQEK